MNSCLSQVFGDVGDVCLSFPAVLSFLLYLRHSWGCLRNVKGFHLEAPASQGRVERRVCPSLAVTHEAQSSSGRSFGFRSHISQSGPAWELCGPGICWEGVLLCGVFIVKVQCIMRPPDSLEGKGAGKWSLTLARTHLYISRGSSQAESHAHAVPVVLRFISELEARVREHPGDPGTW